MIRLLLSIIIGFGGFIVVLAQVLPLTTSTRETTTHTPIVELLGEQAPVVASSSLPNRVVLVGDVMLARDVDRRSRIAKDPHHPFTRISFSNLPAYVLGNFEATMPRQYRETPSLTFAFAVPSSSAPVLTEAGFTHLSLANNHSFDYGRDGYHETLSYLTQVGLNVAGHGQTVGTTSVMYLEMASSTLAVLTLSAIGVTPSSTVLESLMAESTRRSDWQLVYVHWGVEYALKHHISQMRLAEQLVSFGADAIVGHHPHVVQDIAYVAGVPVIFSLGNFIFDQYFSREVEEGLVAVFDFATQTIRLYPVTSKDARVQPRYMTSAEARDFLTRVAERSESSLYSQIQNGVLPLRGMVATSSKAVMIQ